MLKKNTLFFPVDLVIVFWALMRIRSLLKGRACQFGSSVQCTVAVLRGRWRKWTRSRSSHAPCGQISDVHPARKQAHKTAVKAYGVHKDRWNRASKRRVAVSPISVPLSLTFFPCRHLQHRTLLNFILHAVNTSFFPHLIFIFFFETLVSTEKHSRRCHQLLPVVSRWYPLSWVILLNN